MQHLAGLPAPSIAARLRELLSVDGQSLPESMASEDDPIEVLRYASGLNLDAVGQVEATLRDAELATAETALPTPHAREVIVETYLAAHRLAKHVDVIVGRTEPDPRLLKPHPHFVLQALGWRELAGGCWHARPQPQAGPPTKLGS